MNIAKATTRPSARRTVFAWLLPVFLCAVTLVGCEVIEELGTDVPDDKKSNSDTAPTVINKNSQDVDTAVPEPNIEITLGDIPIAAEECHVTVLPAAGGYSATLRVTSYSSPDTESFPSIFIQADISSDKITEVLNQKFPAKIYIQTSQKAVIWETPDVQPGEITIKNADDLGRVIGVVTAGAMMQLGSADSMTLSGSFDGRRLAD